MKFFKKAIFTGFMPNLLAGEVLTSFSFFLPWNFSRLQKGSSTPQVESWLQNFFGVQHALVFDSGRSSLYMALHALGINEGDEVLLQGYTCLVVSNAIIWAGAKPVYIDVTDDFNMDAADLERKITEKSKILIIQHSFGIPADLEKILLLARKYNLKVIEDCAHVIGEKYSGDFLGTWGDIGILSFGTDKALSCGRGGAILSNNKHIAEQLRQQQSSLSYPSRKKILQQLFTFILFFFSKPFYNIGVGKIILGLAKKWNLTSRIIEKSEKRGERSLQYPSHLPNALSRILLHQLHNLERFNTHRRELSLYYSKNIHNSFVHGVSLTKKGDEEIPFLRFPLRVQNPQKLHDSAKQEGILLGDWYNSVVAPQDGVLQKMGYTLGSCPRAEQLAKESVNLPTSIHITQKDADKIIEIVNHYSQ